MIPLVAQTFESGRMGVHIHDPHPPLDREHGGAGAGPGPLRSAASSGLRRAPPGRLPAPSAMSSICPTLPRPSGPAPPPVPPSHRWPWRLGGGGGGLHRQLDVARNRAIDASREAAGGRGRERPDYREPRAGHQHRAGRGAAGEGTQGAGGIRHPTPPPGLGRSPSRATLTLPWGRHGKAIAKPSPRDRRRPRGRHAGVMRQGYQKKTRR